MLTLLPEYRINSFHKWWLDFVVLSAQVAIRYSSVGTFSHSLHLFFSLERYSFSWLLTEQETLKSFWSNPFGLRVGNPAWPE